MKQRLAQKWRPDFWFFVKFAVITSMCLFIVYPFYTIITKSIFSDKVEGVTLYNFIRFFTKKYYYEPLIRSIVVCSTTVLTSMIDRYADYEIVEIVTPAGENVKGDEYYEFYVDAQQLDDLILRLFYEVK